MKSFLQELTNSLRNNKLRTFLTGFTIAWGIIILVVMLGAGKGVEHGIREMVAQSGAGQAEVKISLDTTTKAYAGYQEGRTLELTESQLAYLQQRYASEVIGIVPSHESFGNISTNYGDIFMRSKTMTPISQSFNKLELQEGRLFSSQDFAKGHRVILVSEFVTTSVAPHGGSAIGLTATIAGANYEIIGVVKSESPFFGNVYIPYQTCKNLRPNDFLKIKEFTLYPISSNAKVQDALTERIKADIRAILKVDPTDPCFYTESTTTNAETLDNIFKVLTILLWVMGVGSLSIGTIGVSNIMHVTIQERSREIGIRKAIGAKPRDIMTLVLGESILLSIASGFIGLLIGTGLVQLMDYASQAYHWGEQVIPTGPSQQMTLRLFVDPEVNIGVATGALIVLVVAGLIAGYGPAKKAIRIPAVVAMRDQK